MAIEVPAGFLMNGIAAGIKKSGKEDFTLIHCPGGATAAGVYTQNLVFAAPVGFDRARTPSANIRVIAVNSGNANACTGEGGMQDCQEMARLASAACGEDEGTSLVMSTGVIGVFLPMDKIANGAKLAAANMGSDEASFLAAARGIMTTDQFHKVVGKKLDIGGRSIRLAGMCKGAGMIGPHMATMLAIMLTDAKLSPADAQRVLKAATDESFNCISVEGHMSTNDTLLLVASGAAGGEPLAGSDLQKFQAALTEACIELAQQIPDDGEGASHLICIQVQGCKDQTSAQQIARTVANSALVKTAVAGADPNWGRIVSAAGYAGIPFKPEGVGLIMNGHELYRAGAPLPFDAKTVSQAIKNSRKTNITLTFTEGSVTGRFWTSDLNVNYVRFNSEYTT